MRISDAYRCVAFAAVLGFAGQAFAFDVKSLNADTSPQEALQGGLELYRKGDKSTAFEALNFAAEKGDPIAQWQTAKMLAEGDGVKQDDYKAFELFSEIADAHADDQRVAADVPAQRFRGDARRAVDGPDGSAGSEIEFAGHGRERELQEAG